MIQVTCEHCGRRLHIADTHAGEKGRCPHCRKLVQVPGATLRSAGSAEHAEGPDAAFRWSARDAALLDLPQAHATPQANEAESASGDGGLQTVGASSEERPAGEPDEDASNSFLYVLAYPANFDGLVQIGVLVGCFWLVSVFGGLLGLLAGPYGGLLAILGQAIVVGYAVFYVGYCIYDSSHGGRRAPTISLAHTPDLADVVAQLLLLVAAVAICLWPAALYRGVAGHTNAWFWALGVLGACFLPMSLLTAALFDGIDALNPLLILRSIVTTLPAYLGLLLELWVLGGIFLAVNSLLGHVPLVRVLSQAAHLYLLLVAAHLLGRFYWRHKDRLGWGL